jgi:hypothetical protein
VVLVGLPTANVCQKFTDNYGHSKAMIVDLHLHNTLFETIGFSFFFNLVLFLEFSQATPSPR